MDEYFYYYDEKVTIWKRNFFKIREENKEWADKKAKEIIAERGVDWELEVDKVKYLFDTEEPYSEESNDSPTLELFSKEDEKLLYSNNW